MRNVLNTLTGIVTEQPDNIVKHDILGRYFIEVPEGTKNLVPGMFRPGTAEEFVALNARTSDAGEEVDEPAEANANPEKNGDN